MTDQAPPAKPQPEITDLNCAFFDGCAQGELRVRKCNACETRFRFAHAWCPECWSADIGWEKASGQAKVTHFSVVHQAPSAAFQAEAPYVLAIVDLAEGVRMMTNIVDCDPDTVHVGMNVAVSFEQRGDVSLPVFRPVRV